MAVQGRNTYGGETMPRTYLRKSVDALYPRKWALQYSSAFVWHTQTHALVSTYAPECGGGGQGGHQVEAVGRQGLKQDAVGRVCLCVCVCGGGGGVSVHCVCAVCVVR